MQPQCSKSRHLTSGMLQKVAGVVKLATLVPPLAVKSLHIEHAIVLLVGLSGVRYSQTADMLLTSTSHSLKIDSSSLL